MKHTIPRLAGLTGETAASAPAGIMNSLAVPRATIVSTPPHPAICLVRYSVVWILWGGAQAARHRPLLQPLVGQNQDRLVTTTMKRWPRHREVRLIAKLALSWACPRPSCSLALACTSTGRDALAVVATTRHRSTPLLGTVPACSLMTATPTASLRNRYCCPRLEFLGTIADVHAFSFTWVHSSWWM